MLISHRKRFIYTKTLKTAGTSVESYFEPYCMPEGQWQFSHARPEYVAREGIIGYRGPDQEGLTWYNHMSAAEIKGLIGAQIWNSYFKFCVVRNPFDKLLSHFYYLLQKGFLDPQFRGGSRVRSFRRWLQQGGSVIDRDKYLIDGQVCVDFFIRYEDLHRGIRAVCDQLDLPFEPEKVPRLKAGMRSDDIPIRDYYDAAAISIVRELYAFELDYFNYDLPL